MLVAEETEDLRDERKGEGEEIITLLERFYLILILLMSEKHIDPFLNNRLFSPY